jgi:hypothetical protein
MRIIICHSPPMTDRPSPHTQVVIVPIVKKDSDRESVMAAVDGLVAALKGAGIRVKVGLGRWRGCGW